MKLLAKIGIWGLLVAGSGTALQADPAGGWLSPNGTSGATGATSGASTSGTMGSTGGLTGSVSGDAHVNVAAQSLVDLQVHVHQLQEQARADARHVQHLQQIARREKDVIKLNCVNDKLVQIKPELNLGDSAANELAAAPESSRMAAFQGATLAAENVRRLREEADQCIGEPVTQGSESSNSFTSPTVPDDPTRGWGGNKLEPPVYASPYN